MLARIAVATSKQPSVGESSSGSAPEEVKNLLVILRLLKEQFGDVQLEQSTKRFIVHVGKSAATIDHETKVM